MIIIIINLSQPVPKDSHQKSQDTITSLTSYHVWPFKARWQQKATHTHTLIKHAQSSAITRHMSQRYIKSIFGRYRLHSLHGQFRGHQFLIPDLKALKVFTFFTSAGTISQIIVPKHDRLSVPLFTLLTGGIEKSEVWRSW